jgi:hypothetical protein
VVVVADVIHLLDNLLGTGVAITDGVIAATFSLLLFALAWMTY